MDQEESHARFKSLVSGTAAGQIAKSSYFQNTRNTNDGIMSDLPPDGSRGQQSSRKTFGKSVDTQDGRVAISSGDLIRRSRAEDSRTSLLDGMRFSSPLSQMDMDGIEDEHDQHASNGRMVTLAQATRHNASRAPQPREFVKLRTSKSMHQRSDLSSSHMDTSAHGYLHQRSTTHHPATHNTVTQPSAHSRSASIASSMHTQLPQDDDISSIMMRGATGLRNAKFEIEELRREMTFLQSQVESTKLEKEELSKRLKSVKDAAKNGLEMTARSLEGVRVSMESLKTQSEATFAFAVQAKAALPDVKELRGTVAEAVKGIESVTNEDGRLFEVLGAKEVIDELKLECSGSSQVIDMLREKLQSIGSELVDAKIRVSELESLQAADREALRASSASLSDASQQTRKLVESLKDQQTELNSALLSAADFENKFAEAQVRVRDLNELIEKKNVALEQVSALQADLNNTQLILREKEAQINELRCLQDRLDLATKDSAEYLAQVRVLEASVALKDETIVNLETRTAEQESQLQTTQNTVLSLKQNIATTTMQEASLRQELSSKEETINDLVAKQASIQESLDENMKELEHQGENLYGLQSKYQIMEERYETQLVTTKCAQETQADLQERLLESQAKYARELEAATGKRDTEIALLVEQKVTLLAKIEDLEASARLQREELIAIKADYDERIVKLEDAHRVQLELSEKRVDEVHVALEDARTVVKSHEEQVAFSKQETLTLREELREARLPSPAHKETLDALTAQITALRLENTELVLRARSIDSRYRTGDLNEEEKAFINTLIQTSQSIHEQDMVSKGNELRRRDNSIKELQAKIQSLESTLAKHLKSQNKVVVVEAADNRSLIDPAAWATSSDKGSSHPRVADEDMPSTNVDNTVTAKPTPAPVRPSSRAPLAIVPQPDPNTKPLPTRTPARLLRHPPAGAPTAKGTPVVAKKTVSPVQSSSPLYYPQPKTPAVRGLGAQNQKKPDMNAHNGPKAMFSRLATDCSDEIVDYEERSRKPSPIGTPPEANAVERAQPGKTRLGKREKPASSAEGGQNSAKRPRRLRSHMRSRAAPQQDEPMQKNVDRQPKIRSKNRPV